MAIQANIIVPTKAGFLKAAQLSVGDIVYDVQGEETRITDIQKEYSNLYYDLSFGRDAKVEITDDQIIVAVYLNRGKKISTEEDFQYLAASDIFSLKAKTWTVRIPTVILNGEGRLGIDPYLFGLWLGDGVHVGASISTHQDDLQYIKTYIEGSIYNVGTIKKDHGLGARISVCDGFRKHLRDIGVLGNKHIPQKVFTLDKDYRLEVIRGLVDSDGAIYKGRVVFGNTNYDISHGCLRLASSLGEVVNFYSAKYSGFGKTGIYYGATWKPRTMPVRFPRKKDKVEIMVLHNSRAFRNCVLEVGEKKEFINITTESGTILVTDYYIPCGAGCSPRINIEMANRLLLERGEQYGKQMKEDKAQEALNKIKGIKYTVERDCRKTKKEIYRRILYVDGIACKGYKEAAARAGCTRGYIETAIRRGYNHIKGHPFKY